MHGLGPVAYRGRAQADVLQEPQDAHSVLRADAVPAGEELDVYKRQLLICSSRSPVTIISSVNGTPNSLFIRFTSILPRFCIIIVSLIFSLTQHGISLMVMAGICSIA